MRVVRLSFVQPAFRRSSSKSQSGARHRAEADGRARSNGADSRHAATAVRSPEVTASPQLIAASARAVSIQERLARQVELSMVDSPCRPDRQVAQAVGGGRSSADSCRIPAERSTLYAAGYAVDDQVAGYPGATIRKLLGDLRLMPKACDRTGAGATPAELPARAWRCGSSARSSRWPRSARGSACW